MKQSCINNNEFNIKNISNISNTSIILMKKKLDFITKVEINESLTKNTMDILIQKKI